jgi:hypothetical protein
MMLLANSYLAKAMAEKLRLMDNSRWYLVGPSHNVCLTEIGVPGANAFDGVNVINGAELLTETGASTTPFFLPQAGTFFVTSPSSHYPLQNSAFSASLRCSLAFHLPHLRHLPDQPWVGFEGGVATILCPSMTQPETQHLRTHGNLEW